MRVPVILMPSAIIHLVVTPVSVGLAFLETEQHVKVY